jgi:TatD DNase family protein
VNHAGTDFHCHLDLYKDPADVLRDITRSGVQTIAVTTTPRAFRKNVELFGKSLLVRVGVGIHPELAHTREADLRLFRDLLRETTIVGEIGLDGRPQHRSTLPRQIEIFENILSSIGEARRTKLVSVHSAWAVTPVLDRIEQLPPALGIRIILHWFGGSKAELDRAAKLGCFFSVNGAMLGSDSGRSLIGHMPIDRILTETDGPLTMARERCTVPSDVLSLVALIGASRGMTHCEATEVLQRNTRDAMSGV